MLVGFFKTIVSVLKCREFCFCRRGKGVFNFGNVVRVVFNGSEFCVHSVEFTVCLYCWGYSDRNMCCFSGIISDIIVIMIILVIILAIIFMVN